MEYVRYTFIALVGWGLWAIGSKILTRYFNTMSTAFWVSFWSMVFLTIFLLFRRNLMLNRYVIYSIPIGLVSLAAIVAFYKALKIGPSSVVLPLTNMYVILPVLFGFIVLKEPVTVPRILGIVFAILAAIFLTI
ncbi:MAG: EamA family transporter [candidate division WOR-3 bacterium]|nr:MAG: EamA family transporter [candidate division WOR-3 bacterium]